MGIENLLVCRHSTDRRHVHLRIPTEHRPLLLGERRVLCRIQGVLAGGGRVAADLGEPLAPLSVSALVEVFVEARLLDLDHHDVHSEVPSGGGDIASREKFPQLLDHHADVLRDDYVVYKVPHVGREKTLLGCASGQPQANGVQFFQDNLCRRLALRHKLFPLPAQLRQIGVNLLATVRTQHALLVLVADVLVDIGNVFVDVVNPFHDLLGVRREQEFPDVHQLLPDELAL